MTHEAAMAPRNRLTNHPLHSGRASRTRGSFCPRSERRGVHPCEGSSWRGRHHLEGQRHSSDGRVDDRPRNDSDRCRLLPLRDDVGRGPHDGTNRRRFRVRRGVWNRRWYACSHSRVHEASKWLKIAIPLAFALGLAVIALHPTPRRKLREAASAVRSKWPDFKAEAGALVEQFASELRVAETNARTALEILRQQIPSSKKGPTLRQYAYRACLEAGAPISVEELESRIRGMGYVTGSRQLGPYLRRVLRSDSRFREASTGWDLSLRVQGEARTFDVTTGQPTESRSL